jgi:polysaccharide deacetylase family protein (PEP-CTERM system associated)
MASPPPRHSVMTCIFSVDVEDWFHVLDLPSAPRPAQWDLLPSRVEQGFLRLLDLFSERDVQVTCFFLGWVARRFSHLVKEADKRGHEIASHGCLHRLVYEMTRSEFLADAIESRKVLEDIVGRRVVGYRSAGFSVVEETPWFFDALIEAEYGYDSSVFPAKRGHGGLRTDQLAPFFVGSPSGALIEFPITVAKILSMPICFFGGGYLRLFPLSLIEAMTSRVLAERRPVVFYIHPREVDPSHPRLPMSLGRRFKSYVNLRTTEAKIRRLLRRFPMTTFQNFIANDLNRVAGLSPVPATRPGTARTPGSSDLGVEIKRV